MMRKLALLLLLLCGCAAASTTTYYVDAGYTGGSNDGSQAHPYTGLQVGGTSPLGWSAVNTALASGPVQVYFSARQPGSSSPAVTTNQIDLSQRTDTSSNILTLDGISQYNSGTATVPVWSTNVIPLPCAVKDSASPGACTWFNAAKFTIQASIPITGPTGTSDYLNCKSNFVVQGFSFQGNGGQSADLTYLSNLTIAYSEITRIAVGSNGPGTYIGPGQHGPCHTGAARPGGVDSGPDNVTLQYNWIHATWGECIYSGASTSDPFNGACPSNQCQQYEGGSSGSNLACGNGCSLNSQVCATPGTAASCSTGQNYLIDSNTIESCAAWGGQGDGIDIKDGHSNLTITHNSIKTTKYPSCHGTCTNLVCWGGTNAGTSCNDNSACTGGGVCGAGNDGRGMVIESCSLIDSNYVEAPGHDGIDLADSWNTSTGRSACRVSNNITVNINSNLGHNSGLELESLNVSGLAKWGNVQFENNSVYNAGNGSNTSPCILTGSGSASGTVLITNNIFSTCNQTSSIGIGTASFNDYWHNTTGSCPNSETGTICTDPLFVSTASYVDTNFKLQVGSGATGVGANLGGTFTNDYFGTLRTGWTIGAYEFPAVGGPTYKDFVNGLVKLNGAIVVK